MIKAGDVVVMKSSSPLMTVRWVENDDAYCEWFVNGEVKGSKFKIAQLVVKS